MKNKAPGIRAHLLILIGWLLATGVVWAYEGETHKNVAGMDIYIGVIPAEVIQGRDMAMEKKMHGGSPQGKNWYHLVVALFDTKTGARITNAEITANIAGIGLGGSTKNLESMKVDDVVTYGNYFALPQDMPYRIRLKLEVPGKVATEALFESSGS